MDIREAFKEQLKNWSTTVTENKLAELKCKVYSDGTPIEIGDIILYGLILDEEKNAMNLISFPERLVDEYRIVENSKHNTVTKTKPRMFWHIEKIK